MSQVNAGSHPVGPRGNEPASDRASDANSAVSWAAILAGAAAAAALSLVLLVLGAGLGFSVMSPWSQEGMAAASIGFAAIAWLTFTQLAASGMGGYLAGRLRNRWAAAHSDEVFFRDTAHGFLTWTVATLLTAAVLTSVMGAIVNGGVQAGAAVADEVGSAAAGAVGGQDSESLEYFVDTLFRRDPGSSDQGGFQQSDEATEIPVGEVTRIFARAVQTGSLPPEDERYIGQLMAQRTNLNQQAAEQRVADAFDNVQSTLEEAETSAREAADEARKASAYAALWIFITLLMGAFAASLLAVFGGRQRDAWSTHG